MKQVPIKHVLTTKRLKELVLISTEALMWWCGNTENTVVFVTLPRGWKRPSGFPRKTRAWTCLDGTTEYYEIDAAKLLAWCSTELEDRAR